MKNSIWSKFKVAYFALVLLLVQKACALPPSHVPTLDELAGNWQIASNLLSLPAFDNGLGSGKETRDAIAIGDLSFPPITMTSNTGSLLIDGEAPILDETRWFAYQALRRASAGNLVIETAVRMPYEQRGLLFQIVITNGGTDARKFELKLNLCAATSSHTNWGWGVPRDKTAAARFSVTAARSRRSLLFSDESNHLANCFAFAEKPNTLLVEGNSGEATWKLNLKPGATLTINYVLAIGKNAGTVHDLTQEWAKNFDTMFGEVPMDWQERFNAMFTPGNSDFSGSLPVLETSDKNLRRTYYMSALTLLSVMRTGFPVQPRVYVSNSPESNCTMMYFWDTREWATVFALLDPAMLKNCLRSWLTKNIYDGYSEEYLTGTLKGPWYSANDYSVFMLLNDYLNVTGDRAFLSEKIGDQTVLEHMDAIATHWKTLVKPGRTLADYGRPANLLECVPTYTHEVASFNAANVWMMRRVAEIQEAQGNQTRADELRANASHLLAAVLSLYEPGQGVWDATSEDGGKVQIRHVFDFATVGLTIPGELTPQMRGEMTDFVERELLTDHWMRAQSLSDIAAAQSNRPDHGPMGAFAAWPPETMAAFCEFGKFDKALDLLNRCVGVTYEGPYSQSRELSSKMPDALARITSRGGSPNSHQTYTESAGGGFAETIIREFFGYQPDFVTGKLIPDSRPRGFNGQLLNVRQDGRLYNLTSSSDDGLTVKSVDNSSTNAAEAPAAAAAEPVTIEITNSPGYEIPADFAGLSFETGQQLPNSHHVSGCIFSPTNTQLITLFRNMDIKNLRIGGGTVDGLDAGHLSQANIDDLFGFAQAAGLKVIFSLQLLNGNTNADAATAEYVWQHYRRLVDWLAVGNEPDEPDYRYPPFGEGKDPAITNYLTYLAKWQEFASAVTDALPGITFVAPDTGGYHWNTDFADDEKSSGLVSLFTTHDYFGGHWEGQTPETAVSNMLSPRWVNKLYPKELLGTSNVIADGYPYRLTEINDYLGGVANASDAYASALWGLDVLHWWAAHGAAGVNFHNNEWLLTDTVYFDQHRNFEVRPKAYGIKGFNLGGRGSVEPVAITNPGNLNLTAYAVANATNLYVTLINKEYGPAARAAEVTLRLNGFSPGSVAAMFLTVPEGNVEATSGMTLGGAKISNNAPWAGQWTLLGPVAGNECRISLPCASAVVLKIDQRW